MTGKLLKYDFRCMFKQFAIVWPAALAIALLNGLVQSGPGGFLGDFEGSANVVLMMLFVGVMIAMCVISAIFIITRFNSGLLRDEGYLMFTLPVTPVQLILSKLITAVVVVMISGIVGMLSMMMLMLNYVNVPQMFNELREFLFHILQIDGRWWLVLVEMLLAGIITAASGILQIYACIAIGHLAGRHRTAVSVIAFVVLSSVSSQFMQLFFRFMDRLGITGWVQSLLENASGSFSFTAYALLFYIGIGLVSCVVWFAVATYILSRKLNLE